jgi:hypothetical protein
MRDLIHTAQTANAREQQRQPQTFHQIEVSHLAAKLIGLEQTIDQLQNHLQSKPQTVDEIKTWQTAVAVKTSLSEVAALQLKVAALERQLQTQNHLPAPKKSVKSRSKSPTTQKNPELQSTTASQFATPPHSSTFGEENPEIPLNLHELNLSSTEDQSPANGQPITILQTEDPNLYPAEGIEQ